MTGVSCIAVAADSIFAEAVLELGGDFAIIVPAADYRQRQVTDDHADLFDSLVDRATCVRVMPHDESNRAAYASANETLVNSIDLLFAVWDGRAPVDRGGTAAVVEYARSTGTHVEIIWPQGAQRRSGPPSGPRQVDAATPLPGFPAPPSPMRISHPASPKRELLTGRPVIDHPRRRNPER
ncbi:hypothetical protein [Frankia sp. AgB1.9]|uniref:hypothetical protein n=1 Tax=Frankia sp. AgB1.9 TaxID=1836968 RepID=UPI001A473518|nr:hypothetical protein [Frankia sp. AgB1.9]MBL7622671.1 hypothetical protein [Frankia sp. AgB1.8]